MVVTTLRPKERLQLDHESLGALIAELGPRDGQAAICAMLEDMADRLIRAEAAWRRSEFDALADLALGVAALAGRVGMPVLARVAREIVPLAAGTDGAALGAVVARLARLAETALFDIWDVELLSI